MPSIPLIGFILMTLIAIKTVDTSRNFELEECNFEVHGPSGCPPTGLVCNQRTGFNNGKNYCQCRSQFSLAITLRDGVHCYERVDHGQTCFFDDQCRYSPSTVCRGATFEDFDGHRSPITPGNCSCIDGHFFSTHNQCQKIASLGDNCRSHEECLEGDRNSMCKLSPIRVRESLPRGHCDCAEDFKVINGSCSLGDDNSTIVVVKNGGNFGDKSRDEGWNYFEGRHGPMAGFFWLVIAPMIIVLLLVVFVVSHRRARVMPIVRTRLDGRLGHHQGDGRRFSPDSMARMMRRWGSSVFGSRTSRTRGRTSTEVPSELDLVNRNGFAETPKTRAAKDLPPSYEAAMDMAMDIVIKKGDQRNSV